MNNKIVFSILTGAIIVCTSSLAEEKVINDGIFPPLPVAKSAIDFDVRGFIVNGKRTFISSGSVHYPRVPRQLWEDRLLRMKQANFNTVETYAFWNLHEPVEGQFDFKGEKDIGAFFDTAQKLGLYAIARVGPYVCAEWDQGGYPVWLRFKPEVLLRSESPAFMALNDIWYQKIMEQLASRQINRGGNIVLVQLENENPAGWGRVETPYFKRLTEMAVKHGLEVPHFMSGLHHGFGPQPGGGDTSRRTNPWFTTEFWAGWFDLYGPMNNRQLRTVENAQWMIMAKGGGGQNIYMLHGGTNFDSWNDSSGGASYDYGAAIGQTGDLRPAYYRMKRANQLAQSFPEILADGADASAEYKQFVKGAQISGARRSPAGTIVFIKNDSASEQTVEFKDGTQLTAQAKETFPIVIGAKITENLSIADSTVRVLGVAQTGKTVTVVVHGKPGETGQLVLQSGQPLKAPKASGAFAVENGEGGRLRLRITIPENTAEEIMLEGEKQNVRVVAVTRDIGLYTWIVGEPGKQQVVCGPAFVRSVEEKVGQCSLVIERPYGLPAPGHVAVFGEKSFHLAATGNPTLETAPAPILTNLQKASPMEAEPGFDDSGWKQSDIPLEMGADNDASAFTWYRAIFEAPEAGTGTLAFQASDKAALLINGQLVSAAKKGGMGSREFNISYHAGKNTVAILVSHIGRNKALNKAGTPLANFYTKGITSAVTVVISGKKQEIHNWKMRGGLSPDGPDLKWAAFVPPAVSTFQAASQRTASPNAGSESGAPVFIKATFQAPLPGKNGAYPIYRTDFSGLRSGTMWLNGKCLGRYPEKIRINSLYLPECWLKPEGNELVVFDEDGADNVKLVVETAASREIMQISQPVSPAMPIVVPPENPPKDLPVLNQGNLAFRATASASSSKNDEPCAAASDGDIDTSWSAANADAGAWLSVDLGQTCSIGVCEIMWASRAIYVKYVLESSMDGQTWTKIGDETTAVPSSTDSPSTLSRHLVPQTTARYMRVSTPARTGEKKGPWPSVTEFRIFEK